MTHTAARLVTVLALSTFAAVGCGSDDSTESAATEAPTTTQTPATTEAPTTTEAPATTETPATTEAPASTVNQNDAERLASLVADVPEGYVLIDAGEDAEILMSMFPAELSSPAISGMISAELRQLAYATDRTFIGPVLLAALLPDAAAAPDTFFATLAGDNQIETAVLSYDEGQQWWTWTDPEAEPAAVTYYGTIIGSADEGSTAIVVGSFDPALIETFLTAYALT